MRQILFSLALALFAIGAYAQDAEQGPKSHEHMGDRMRRPSPAEHAQHLAKELGLSKDQTAKVQEIFATQQKKHEAEMQAGGQELTPEQRREQFMQARQQVDAQIEALLTDAQKQKFAQMKSRMKERRGPGEPRPDGEQPPPPDPQQ